MLNKSEQKLEFLQIVMLSCTNHNVYTPNISI